MAHGRWVVRRGAALGVDGIEALTAASTGLVGGPLPSAPVLRARLVRDPGCVTAIVATTGDGPSVVAHSVVYGIDDATTDALADGTVANGVALPLEGLTDRSPRSFYIGMVAGRGSRILALRLLVTHLVDRQRAAPRADRLFARPGTGAGRRLLGRSGFRPIGGSSEVWSRPTGTWPAPDRPGAGPDALVSRRYVHDLFVDAGS